MQYSKLFHALEALARAYAQLPEVRRVAQQSGQTIQPGVIEAADSHAASFSAGQPGRAAIQRGHEALRQHRLVDALEQFRLGLEQADADGDAHVCCARVLNRLGRHEEAIVVCQAGVANHPRAEGLYQEWVEALQLLGRTTEAVELVQRTAARYPTEVVFAHTHRLLLPLVYQSAMEIGAWRDRYTTALDALVHSVDFADPTAVSRGVRGISDQFYLAYQCQDDRPLQAQYGRFVRQLLSAQYPDGSLAGRSEAPVPGAKLRVGYVSAHLCFHTVGKLFLGWLQSHNRDQFEVFAYHLGEGADYMTDEFERAVDHFHHLPARPRAVCEQVQSDDLHVLVFLDIGMNSDTVQIAGRRLAPVQCVSWGHPVTSGLPTIDYFLSSELMEPPDGDSHYSETLVRLPGVGVSVPAPYLSSSEPVRTEFDLPEEAVVYLSPQSLFKYLPQYDFVFVEIARHVPNAKFVYLERPNEAIARLFRERLLSAFNLAGLDGERHLVALPRQGYSDYLRLNRVADVFLDTLGWSGGMSTLEALGCGLPVVTCPGEFMRGRHTLGFLRQLDVMDTVAASLEGYVDIAIRLGHDEAWRQDVKTRIAANADRLYDDRGCVTGLESFLWAAVQQHCPLPGEAGG